MNCFSTHRGRFIRPALVPLVIFAGLAAVAPVQADDVNLTFSPTAGWSYPVVPQFDGTSTTTSCLLPSLIPTFNGYWNAHGENTGADPTSGGFDITYYVDGSMRAIAYAPVTSGDFFVLNEGPGSYMDAGRHTVHCYVDVLNGISETDETDNFWGRQFTGLAPLLPADHTTWQRPAPPPRTGGWEYISDGSTPKDNFTGYLASSGTGGGQAIVMGPLDAADDYDLRLFLNEDNSPIAEFDTPLTISNRAAGLLEVVFVFDQISPLTYQAAVVNMNGGGGDHIAFRELAYPCYLDDIYPGVLSPVQLLMFHRIFLPPEDQGWIKATVQIDPGETLHVVLFTPAGVPSFLALDDADVATTVDSNGTATLIWEVLDYENQYVAVYRNPQEVGVGNLNYSILFEHMDPVADLKSAVEEWWSPLVPTPTHQTSDPVVLPTSLPGNVASTYHNFQFRNDGYTGTPVMTNRQYLDGVGMIPIFYMSGVDAQTTRSYHGSSAQTVRGGRHTVGVIYDLYDDVIELDEDNNTYAEQFIWSPLALTYGVPVTRAAPPSLLATTELIPDGVTIYPNCDGLRIPEIDLSATLGGWWRGVSAMSAVGDNADLDLHDPSSGSKDGFAVPHVTSDEKVSHLDYVLVNFHESDSSDYDIGLLNGIGSCTQDVVVEAVSSFRLGMSGGPHFGPYSLPPDHGLDVLEICLAVGQYALRVDNLSGYGRLGFAMHDASEGFVACGDGLVYNGQDLATASGDPVYFTVNLKDSGCYGLTIWKMDSADLPLDISYGLQIMEGISDVQEMPAVTSTGLTEVFPNPFNPKVHLVCEVRQEQNINIAIFDVKGRCVRTLWDGPKEAGRHEIIWDGTDDQGQGQASGIYLARMVSREGPSLRRITLVR